MSSAASTIIDASSKSLARWIVERQVELAPSLAARYDGARDGRWQIDWVNDTRGRLSALAEALAFDAPALFVREILWARSAFAARGVPLEDLSGNLTAMSDVLAERLPPGERTRAADMVRHGLEAAASSAEPSRCLFALGEMYAATPLSAAAKQYLLDLLEARSEHAWSGVSALVRAGTPARDVYRWVLEPVMVEIGRMWMVGEIGIADEHYASATTEMVMSRLRDAAPVVGRAANGKCVLAAAVGGDLHSIGVRMVSDVLEMEGWECQYLGASMPGFAMHEAVERVRPRLVALSAQLVHHVRAVAAVVADIRAGMHGAAVPILVGGMPFALDPSLAAKVGADGTAASAWEAADVAERLTRSR